LAARGLRGRFSALGPDSFSFSDTDFTSRTRAWGRKGMLQKIGASGA
jgi:hypothetical protein